MSSLKQLTVEDYSEKSIVVRGPETFKYKENLKEMGGKYNANLTGGVGWVFVKSMKKDLLSFIGSNKEPKAVQKDETIERKKTCENNSDLQKQIDNLQKQIDAMYSLIIKISPEAKTIARKSSLEEKKDRKDRKEKKIEKTIERDTKTEYEQEESDEELPTLLKKK